MLSLSPEEWIAKPSWGKALRAGCQMWEKACQLAASETVQSRCDVELNSRWLWRSRWWCEQDDSGRWQEACRKHASGCGT